MTALVQIRRVPCGGRIVPEVDVASGGFPVASATRLVQCTTCRRTYHVTADDGRRRACVRIRLEKAE